MTNLTPLSASRLKTAQTCSWIYWCKYKLHLPDKSNDGASRGSICHLVFECLGNPRHESHYKKILKAGSIKGSKATWRMVLNYAKKLNVDDEENLSLIDNMTVNGLNYDFFGEDLGKPTEGISEKEFNIEVNEGGKRYRIRGFIDKLFLYSKKKKALIRDFKSSKQVFKGKEVTDNLQNLMYALAVQKLYPNYLKRESEFVFLKFDLTEDLFGKKGSGIVRMGDMEDDELEGFEYYLTEAQSFIDNFSEEDGLSNLAAKQRYPSDGTFGGPLACGKDGFKMSKGEPLLDERGEPIKAFICSYRKPFNYYVLLNEKGKVIKSVFEEDKLELTADESSGETIEERHYNGCPHWNRKDPFEL
jgi:hypothetical protein